MSVLKRRETQNLLFLLRREGFFAIWLDALTGDLSTAKQCPTQLLTAMLAAVLILPFHCTAAAWADGIATGLKTVIADSIDLCGGYLMKKVEKKV